MNLNLNPTLEKFVDERLDSGEYSSENEIVCQALQLLMRYKAYQTQMAQLRLAIQEGEDAIARGDYVDLATNEELEAFFAELKMDKEKEQDAFISR